jgi:RHS repeat-associated protein
MADETGTKVNEYHYSPHGVDGTFTEKVSQPYRYVGGYQDPIGLYHFAARYYDPRIGRFSSPDPSGQEKNPYLYAEGDPSGLAFLGALGPVGDVIQAGVHLKEGDTKALWGDVAGAAADAVVVQQSLPLRR